MKRSALIIGGSDGIGLGLAERLLEGGWSVRGLSRSPAPIEHTSYQHRVRDVLDPEFRAEVGAWGRESDVVVFCVGVGNDRLPEEGVGEVETLDVNLRSLVVALEAILPSWVERGHGHFLGLSSLVDQLRIPDGASYCASKAGVSSYLECLGRRLRSRGVAVTNVRFGFVDTKMARSDHKPFMISVPSAVRVLERAIARRPLRVSAPRRARWAAAAFRLGQRLLR
ncbi:MAG: SDR family oxidoreductase [Planctomycetota bacterium]